MNRRTLFQALIGSAAASTVAASEYVPVRVGNHSDEVEPQNGFRCYKAVAPRHRWYHRSEVQWVDGRWIPKAWLCPNALTASAVNQAAEN